jgi:hypothetical protein
MRKLKGEWCRYSSGGNARHPFFVTTKVTSNIVQFFSTDKKEQKLMIKLLCSNSTRTTNAKRQETNKTKQKKNETFCF